MRASEDDDIRKTSDLRVRRCWLESMGWMSDKGSTHRPRTQQNNCEDSTG